MDEDRSRSSRAGKRWSASTSKKETPRSSSSGGRIRSRREDAHAIPDARLIRALALRRCWGRWPWCRRRRRSLAGGAERPRKAAEEAFARDELDLAGALLPPGRRPGRRASRKARLLVSAGSVDLLAGRSDGALRDRGLAALRSTPTTASPATSTTKASAPLLRGPAEAGRRTRRRRPPTRCAKARSTCATRNGPRPATAFTRALANKPDQPQALYNLALADLHLRPHRTRRCPASRSCSASTPPATAPSAATCAP